MELAKGFENGALGREIEVLVLGKKALEDELMRSASAQADVGALVMDDLVRRCCRIARQPRIAEGGQRIGRDGTSLFLRTTRE